MAIAGALVVGLLLMIFVCLAEKGDKRGNAVQRRLDELRDDEGFWWRECREARVQGDHQGLVYAEQQFAEAKARARAYRASLTRPRD